MTNKFAQALKKEDSQESVSVTENGAFGFARTNSRLVDFFFKVGSMRNMNESEITTHFAEAYPEDPRRALELMFMVRDVRGGMGEKRTFKACFEWLIQNYPGDAINLLSLIPEYGSWKAFFELTDSFRKNGSVEDAAKVIVFNQWEKDISSYEDSHKVSLMAKWMPSENTSSKDTVRLAKYWKNVLGLDSKTYRKALSKFRKTISLVETAMSSGNWSEINYNTVPSRAGMIYRNAFLRHDEARRRLWLADLANGKENVKINTTGLTVPEMVAKYVQSNGWTTRVANEDDPTIEVAWRDLVSKNMLPEDSQSLLPIMDGSGSMYSPIAMGSNISAIHVSLGLGLFLANINTPAWRGMCIEFGSNPCFFQVPTGASLREQIKIAMKHDDCGSTNVKGVFDLVLNTAIRNGFSQKDIPDLITFSDMEFDAAYPPNNWNSRTSITQEKLFETITGEWNNAGYYLPRQIFWNINSRTGTIPLTENELGISLLSGYSQAIMNMVLSRKLDPLAVLLEKLDSPRYNLIREALK